MVMMMMVVVAEDTVMMMVVVAVDEHAMVVMMVPPPVMMVMVAGKLNLRLVAGLRRRPAHVDSVDGAQQRHGVRNRIEQVGKRVRRRQCRLGVNGRGLGCIERGQSGNRADHAGNPLVHGRLLWWTNDVQ
jgi:hypothetical protein